MLALAPSYGFVAVALPVSLLLHVVSGANTGNPVAAVKSSEVALVPGARLVWRWREHEIHHNYGVGMKQLSFVWFGCIGDAVLSLFWVDSI